MLIGIGISAAVPLMLGGAYLAFLKPNTKRGEAFRLFEEKYVAHRGLFDNAKEYPENSIAAFRRAVEHGYGIELDVQLTLDEVLVVFHDDDLNRMCGVDKKVEECTFEELQQYSLAVSGEKIPLFSDVLDVIDGKSPLVVEIKNSDRWEITTAAAAKMLDEYKGPYCVESFNPFVLDWYRKNRPEIIRGQLSTNYFKDEPQMSFIRKVVLTNLLLNFKAKPDFIAYNHFHKNQFSYKLLRKLFHVKNAAWTVKSQQELDAASDVFTCMIFDSFVPAAK